jgi:transposase
MCACGTSTMARYDSPRRRWRHGDSGACQVWLEADIHRIDCRSCCRVRTEQLPWARPNARHANDFEVDAIVTRVVADHDTGNVVWVEEIGAEREPACSTAAQRRPAGRSPAGG